MNSKQLNVFTGIAGFSWGFVSSCIFNQDKSSAETFMDEPLTRIFYGSIVGGLYSAGASFVVDQVPKQFKIIVPLSCMIATGFHVYKHCFFDTINIKK